MSSSFSSIGAKRILALRRTHRMSQQQLADLTGVSRSCVASWENGTRIPKASVLCEMASHFHVSIDYLCGWIDETTPIQSVGECFIDLSKLNAKGKETLAAYYAFLLEKDEFRT